MNANESDQEPEVVEPSLENPGDVGDVKVVRKRREKAESEFDEASRFWKQIFATELGRREMWRILSPTGFREFEFATSNGFAQPERSWFNTGKKQHGEEVFWSWFRMDPEGVTRMLAENDPYFKILKDGGRR